ncbi:MAG: hypothetical protein AAGD33_15705 [Actinomycetota bacterium]
MSFLAVGWEPELRGLLTVVIGFVILMGSVYLILATNMGARLGFLVSLTALAGWMMLMGLVWWIYGIGLRGPDPSWAPVTGQTVIQDVESLRSVGIIDTLPDVDDGAAPPEVADAVGDVLIDDGYIVLDSSSPAFGQAQTSASEFLEEEDAFGNQEFVIERIFDIGGDRYPLLFNNESLDFVAFFHEPHYVLAEAAPIEAVREEPGRAPALDVVDDTQPRQYVYMIRDLGARRQPAVVLTIGGGLIFLALCYLLHRRDKILEENLSESKAVATA